jgi:hypothetical protein
MSIKFEATIHCDGPHRCPSRTHASMTRDAIDGGAAGIMKIVFDRLAARDWHVDRDSETFLCPSCAARKAIPVAAAKPGVVEPARPLRWTPWAELSEDLRMEIVGDFPAHAHDQLAATGWRYFKSAREWIAYHLEAPAPDAAADAALVDNLTPLYGPKVGPAAVLDTAIRDEMHRWAMLTPEQRTAEALATPEEALEQELVLATPEEEAATDVLAQDAAGTGPAFVVVEPLEQETAPAPAKGKGKKKAAAV